MKVENEGVDCLLDQKVVAQMLSVSPKTLECWRWKGIGPRYRKINKMVRYYSSDVAEFVNNTNDGGVTK